MKKFLIIFVLVMLPLQASWSVVSVYCQPEREDCIAPCYSEAQEQRVSLIDGAEQAGSTSGFLSQYEHSCQAPATSIISSTHQTIPFLSSSGLALQFHEVLLSLPTFSERPERPQWFFVA